MELQKTNVQNLVQNYNMISVLLYMTITSQTPQLLLKHIITSIKVHYTILEMKFPMALTAYSSTCHLQNNGDFEHIDKSQRAASYTFCKIHRVKILGT